MQRNATIKCKKHTDKFKKIIFFNKLMNLGVVLSADYLPLSSIEEVAVQLEKLGYTQISIPEMWGHDIVTQLAIISRATQNIFVASGIMNMFSRSPSLVAMTAATLQELSRGRFVLGLGLSGPKVVENFHGRTFNKPLKRTREFVEIVRSLLNNERLNYPDSLYGRLIGFKLSFKNEFETPIHIASLGPKNMKLTAEIADGWIPVLMPLESFKKQVETIKQHLKSFGKNVNNFDITPFVLSVIGDDEKSLTLLRKHLAYYFGGMGDFYNNMLTRLGYEEIALKIKQLWFEGKRDEAAKTIPKELIDDTCIYGSEENMREKLFDFYDAGATIPLVTLPFGIDLDLGVKTFQALAPINLE